MNKVEGPTNEENNQKVEDEPAIITNAEEKTQAEDQEPNAESTSHQEESKTTIIKAQWNSNLNSRLNLSELGTKGLFIPRSNQFQ